MIPRSPPPKLKRDLVLEHGTSQPPEDYGSKRVAIDLPLNRGGASRARSIGPVVELPQPIATTIRSPFRSPAPDPSQTRIAYYDENIRTLIMEKDKAVKAAREAEESKNIALKAIKDAFNKEKQQWMDTCDMIQAVHNIARGRAQLEVDAERTRFLDDHEELVRQVKIDTLKLNHSIDLLKSSEFWLRHELSELKEEKRERWQEKVMEKFTQKLQEDQEQTSSTYEDRIQQLENDYQQQMDSNANLHRKAEDLEAKLKRERESVKNIDAEREELKTKLEQVQLRLTSVQDELTEKNHEIQSRHRIEQQDIREVEQLRKAKVDLELRLKDMKDGMRQAEEEVRSEQERINAKAKKEKSLFERRISELEAELEEAKEIVSPFKASISLSRRKSDPPPDEPKSKHARSVPSSSQLKASGSRPKSPPNFSKMTKKQPRVETPDEEGPVVSSDVEEVPIPQRNPQSRPRPKPRPKAKPVSKPRSPEVHIGSDGGEVEAQSPRSMGLKRLGKRKPQSIESSSEAPGKVPPEKGSSQQVGNEPSGSVITARKKRKLGGGLATSYAPPSFTSYDPMFAHLSPATAPPSTRSVREWAEEWNEKHKPKGR